MSVETAEQTAARHLQGYLDNLAYEVKRLEEKIERLPAGSAEQATAKLHLEGVRREIEKKTPPPV
jgi:hypothetical protein